MVMRKAQESSPTLPVGFALGYLAAEVTNFLRVCHGLHRNISDLPTCKVLITPDLSAGLVLMSQGCIYTGGLWTIHVVHEGVLVQ